jgi:hypothetical protein
VVEQGLAEIRKSYLERWKKTAEGLPVSRAARSRRARSARCWLRRADIERRPRRQRRHNLKLAESFFRHRRRGLDRFPGCINSAHREHVLGCFILACERGHA